MSNRGSFGAAGGTGGGGGDGAMTGNVYWSPAGNGNAETELEVAALCASGPKVIHLIDAGDVYVIEEDIDVNGSVFTAPNGDPSGRTLPTWSRTPRPLWPPPRRPRAASRSRTLSEGL